jgi:hypothetical protein
MRRNNVRNNPGFRKERRPHLKIVIPPHAGIHFQPKPEITWILAFARMTEGQENVVRRL